MPHMPVEFQTVDRVTLRGDLYTPSRAAADAATAPAKNEPLPCLIMAHGWSCVKEMCLPRLAEDFTRHLNIAVLIYDHRGFGASDTASNAPRQEIVPWEQVSDYSDAVTFVARLEGIDGKRVAIWGYSLAGGHVLQVAAGDSRVAAVIAFCPVVSPLYNTRRMVRTDLMPAVLASFAADRVARATTDEVAMLPVVAADASQPCSNPTAGAYAWFISKGKGTRWRNEMTVRTSVLHLGQEPGASVQFISPRPLLMVVAEHDAEGNADLALECFQRAREPRECLILKDAGHFDVFDGKIYAQSLKGQVKWLDKVLCRDEE